MTQFLMAVVVVGGGLYFLFYFNILIRYDISC